MKGGIYPPPPTFAKCKSAEFEFVFVNAFEFKVKIALEFALKAKFAVLAHEFKHKRFIASSFA